jgi:hypothetical protein
MSSTSNVEGEKKLDWRKMNPKKPIGTKEPKLRT